MSNYEILILTKMEVVEATVQKFLTETLKVKDLKIQKLENNELAYPIKKKLMQIIFYVTLRLILH